jgi:predicted DNA-binding transcriptional regulator AlpA
MRRVDLPVKPIENMNIGKPTRLDTCPCIADSQPMDTEPLLTSTQVGALIGCSAKTVIRMAETNRLPIAHRLPGRKGAYLFRLTDIESAMAKRSA